MPMPVRYYITQSDDHAVVRSVPVAVRAEEAPISETRQTPMPEPQVELGKGLEAGHRRPRVSQLVRAAARRADLHR